MIHLAKGESSRVEKVRTLRAHYCMSFGSFARNNRIHSDDACKTKDATLLSPSPSTDPNDDDVTSSAACQIYLPMLARNVSSN